MKHYRHPSRRHGFTACGTVVDDLVSGVALLSADRDHWKAVAESRPEITVEDAAAAVRGVTWGPEYTPAVARVREALRAHANTPKGDDGEACPGKDVERG